MILIKIWLKEIMEQVAVAKILNESGIDSGSRLALIVVDNSVEFALKFYVENNELTTKHVLTKDQLQKIETSFPTVLDAVIGYAKIDIDKGDFISYHNTRNDLYHRGKPVTVMPKYVDDYIEKAKDIFKKLFNFELKQMEWDKIINDIRKSFLEKKKIQIKETVEFEKVDSLIRMKTYAKIKNTESIMLIIFGFLGNYARPPTSEELKKSLMISGQTIPDNILGARITELRRSGYIERDRLLLKGKAQNKLRKRFLI